MKIRTKLSLLLLLLNVFVIAAAAILTVVSLDAYYRSRIVDELKTQSAVYSSIISHDRIGDSLSYEFLQQLTHTANTRLTLIADDGTVIFESELPRSQLGTLENHRDRPEVRAAYTQEYGVSTRQSATLNIEMIYLAKRLSPGLPIGDGKPAAAVLRVGLPLTAVSQLLEEVRLKIISVSLILILVTAAVSLVIARRITRPVGTMNDIALDIRNGNLERRIPVTSHDELGEFASTLNGMVDRLNNDIKQLKKLERVRTEFLGNVSHELRTPIFAIQGMLETLLGGALEDPAVRVDFAERALHNTHRLNTLLGDLIEISRIESGDMKMSFRYFDPDEFLRTIVREFQGQAEKKQISLVYSPSPGMPKVYGDRDRLKQVMINLLDNAVKYTQERGRVEIGALASAAGSLTIFIRDNGIGIEAEHLPRIFERFYRVDRERSRDAGGTGLGLAIVKHIIEAHGRVIEVESTPGAGTIFRFTLQS
jgi:two-component system phosphate regulon sensor histidine kinase PhoR